MRDKLLTIIIPSFNMDRWLSKCLQSLETSDARLMDLLDVIIVNDGSTDGTSAIAHEFATRHSQSVTVIDKHNGHYGSCINAALPIAKGTFVKVLDADDSFDAVNFGSFLHFLNTVGDVDLVTSDYDIVDENGNVTEYVKLPYPSDREFGMKELAATRHELIMHGVAYRTEIFREIDYKQTEGCVFTDTEWMFKPMLNVKRIRHYNKPVYRYLVGRADQSVSPKLAVRLLPVQKQIFGNILKIYSSAVQAGVSEPYREYMVMYLARIYRIIFSVYFLRHSLDGLGKEFWPWHLRVCEEVPECSNVAGDFGKIFAGHRFEINAVAKWFKSEGRSCLWPAVYRIYYYMRRPSRIRELFG